MKIAFLLNELGPTGGVARVVINLAKNFKKQGHQVQILCINYNSNFINRYGIEKGEVICCKNLGLLEKLEKIPVLGYVSQVIKYIIFGICLSTKIPKEKPTIINSHYYLCGISGFILSKIIGAPHILTIHGVRLSTTFLKKFHNWADYVVLNLLLSHISNVISVDPSLSTADRFKHLSDHIEIIPPCVDESFLDLVREVRPNQRDLEHLKLLYVGRLEKNKGLKDLLIKIAEIKSNWTELKIVGSGSYETYLKRLSKTLKISNKVKFLGFLDEQGKVQVMNDSDILISFSKSEGFPLVILEFFALGKPCIIYPISPFVYENGQLNEWGKKFQKEELGLFLKKEPDSLQEILKSPDIFQLFTENRSKARKEFVTEFSPEIIGNRYLTIFKQIIKSHLK